MSSRRQLDVSEVGRINLALSDQKVVFINVCATFYHINVITIKIKSKNSIYFIF